MNIQRIALVLLCGFAYASAGTAAVDEENLEEFGTGIIEDYGNMHETDSIEWIWIAPGVVLHDYRFEVAPVRNITAYEDADMEDVINASLTRVLGRIGSTDPDAGLLRVESAIYWAERGSNKKMWIPYAGGHLAQAGVGVELVFRDAAGSVVAKLRHSGREGDRLRDAAEELVDDIRRFVRAN